MRQMSIMAVAALLGFVAFAQERPLAGRAMRENPEAKLYRFSTIVEKERPQLDEDTKALIAAYRRNPTDETKAALRAKVAADYDAVVARKKEKLEELRQTAKHRSKIDEMQVIVDEMLRDREARIDATMARFSDERFRPGVRDTTDGYLPVLGTSGRNVCCARFPVTKAEWAKFSGGYIPSAKANHPVVGVSFVDANRYCAWLRERDPEHVYRLPTEAEWEFAAGHMPKDADFNCGVGDTTTPVDAYANTQGACGGSDFWGNCWEWTTTKRNDGKYAVKGGAFDSPRTDCRTEARSESRDPAKGYANVTLRVFREDREPEARATARKLSDSETPNSESNQKGKQ